MGLCTVDRLNRRYGIFLDMSGAFDRVWWPGVFWSLKRSGVKGAIYCLMKDYLRRRWVEMRCEKWKVGKKVNRGCPQGSVLGPQIWKLVMNELIEEVGKVGDNEMIVYADDGVIVVWGNSRRRMEERGAVVIGQVAAWCESRKMKLSQNQTVVMMLKGVFSEDRQPRIDLCGKILKSVSKIKYLGITWGRR